MKLKVKVVIESESQETQVNEEVASFEREDLTPETLGITLKEAKDLLTNVQSTMVEQQVSEYIEQQLPCPNCGKTRAKKGHHEIVFRTLFGKMKLSSPRLYNCSCQTQEKQSFSPLAELLEARHLINTLDVASSKSTDCTRTALPSDQVGIFDVLWINRRTS